MLIRTDLNLTHDWVKVPLRLAADKTLKDSEVRLWIRLAGLIGPRGQFHSENALAAADAVGLHVDAFRNRRRDLRKKGYLREENGEIIVTLPDSNFEPIAQPVVEEVQPVEETHTIAAEEERKPNRPAGTLSPAERKTLIKEAWNKHRLEGWMEVKGALHPSAYIAIEAQTKALEHDRDDYDGFIKRVCDGARVHEWWSKRDTLKIHNLFGYGTPDDKKFTNVEQLYKLGSTKKAASAGFDGSDQAFLDWYHSKGQKQFVAIERIVVDNPADAAKLDSGFTPTDTARVYVSPEGRIWRWTFKNDRHEFYYLP